MPSPQLVVMAAGIGSRYGGLKQIDPVGPSGEIVLDYAIYDAIQAGFSRVVFIIRPEIEAVFRDKVGRYIEDRIDTQYVFQHINDLPDGFTAPEGRVKPWGTAHAVLSARATVNAPFAVINADDFYGQTSFRILGDYLLSAGDTEDGYDFCMVGFQLKKTLSENGHVARGICVETNDGYLESIVERTKIRKFDDKAKYTEDDETWTELSMESVVSMNLWGFTPAYLKELEARFPAFLSENINNLTSEYFVPTIVNDLISEDKARVRILPTNDQWIGVTYPEDKPLVETAIRELVCKGAYPESLWEN